MQENELLTNVKRREENMNRVEVLDKVGTLLSLPNTELYTTEMVANYYGVAIETIYSVLHQNTEELSNNGYSIMKKENLLTLKIKVKTKRGGFDILDADNNIVATGNNKGIATFTKRTVLNVGMLLRDSKIAQEVRSRLLDITHDAEKDNGSVSNVISELNEEQQLMLNRMEAEFNGDFEKVCEINAKLFALKNKRIKELEDEVESITVHSLTIEESTKVINRLMRIIAAKEYNNQFGKVWGDFYSKLNYKLGINVKARTKKKKSDSYLSTMTEDELFKAEEIVRTWANDLNINVQEAIKIA
ncbi:MAG: hypothetical protein U0L26_08975 [Cellulosilyticum sp.]|nr:hypothetical protein [Cellulosilyticum sp.]